VVRWWWPTSRRTRASSTARPTRLATARAGRYRPRPTRPRAWRHRVGDRCDARRCNTDQTPRGPRSPCAGLRTGDPAGWSVSLAITSSALRGTAARRSWACRRPVPTPPGSSSSGFPDASQRSTTYLVIHKIEPKPSTTKQATPVNHVAAKTRASPDCRQLALRGPSWRPSRRLPWPIVGDAGVGVAGEGAARVPKYSWTILMSDLCLRPSAGPVNRP